MDAYEFLFIVQLLVFVGLLLVKFYNVISVGRAYDLRWSFVLFVGSLLAYGVGFVVLLLDFEESLYLELFKLETWSLGVVFLFLFVELVYWWLAGLPKEIKPYKSNAVGERRL